MNLNMLISEGNGQKSLHQQLEKFLLNLCCNTETPTTFSDHHSLDISTAKQNYTIFGDRTFGATPPSLMGVGTPLLLAAIGGLSNVRLKAWMVREQLFLKLHCNALPFIQNKRNPYPAEWRAHSSIKSQMNMGGGGAVDCWGLPFPAQLTSGTLSSRTLAPPQRTNKQECDGNGKHRQELI